MIKSLYKWHHRLGILVTIPILAWCISGLTHPIMANFFKIRPVHRSVAPKGVVVDNTAPNLKQVLEQHHIDSFQQFRWVNYQGAAYYQVLQTNQPPLYFHQQTGQLLEQGEERYAKALARHFLGDSSSAIISLERIEEFTQEYKFINRLLPVYKVTFDRADGMEVYVSTESSRLGTMNNTLRRSSIAIFSWLHNWSFLNAFPKTRLIVLVVFMLLGFLAAASGLLVYGFLWKRFNEKRPQAKQKRWHRRLGLTVALSTLAFTFSGGYHALIKTQAAPTRVLPTKMYTPTDLALLPKLRIDIRKRPVENMSIVSLEGEKFFQVYWSSKQEPPSYFNTKNLQRISQGEERYALAQAKLYTGLADSNVVNTEAIVKFGGEYGFINKRLPVRKVSYKTPQNHTVYIETKTGKLAAVIQDSKRMEALSFLLLHKYHFLDSPLGKAGRDIIIVLVIIMIMAVHLLGGMLWWQNRSRMQK